jgi:N-acetylglucosaminyldiphosphoundecaprenol N-acetyl-beta-D-mannosaminyltransferase
MTLEHRRVFAGGLPISDVRPTAVAGYAASAWLEERRTVLVFAWHVTSLNAARTDAEFRSAASAAAIAYPDGISLTLLARLAGARKAAKIATTDLVPQLLQTLRHALGRAPRVAVVGGEAPVTAAAARALQSAGANVVAARHGYRSEWGPVLQELRKEAPDVILVGLGMPLEAKWCARHSGGLPPAIVVTCGGYLRLLAGIARARLASASRAGVALSLGHRPASCWSSVRRRPLLIPLRSAESSDVRVAQRRALVSLGRASSGNGCRADSGPRSASKRNAAVNS